MQHVPGEDRIRRVGLVVDRRPPGGDRVAHVGPQPREPEVELHEGALGVEDCELLEPVERAVRPGREGGADLRLERVMAREERLCRALLPRVVERLAAPEVTRLGVRPEPESERQGRSSGARLRRRRGGRGRG